MRHANVLVIGSGSPWVEALCLYLGAAHVTTLEYGKLRTNHPQLSVYTPDEMRDLRARGALHQFSVIVTFSSVEHSGLGRYGDALKPCVDLLTLALTLTSALAHRYGDPLSCWAALLALRLTLTLTMILTTTSPSPSGMATH